MQAHELSALSSTPPEPSAAAARASRPPPPTARAVHADLEALVAAAATLDFGDPEAVARLRVRAHTVTSQLAASGLLPEYLVVARDDPGVLVVRALAAAWRRAQALRA